LKGFDGVTHGHHGSTSITYVTFFRASANTAVKGGQKNEWIAFPLPVSRPKEKRRGVKEGPENIIPLIFSGRLLAGLQYSFLRPFPTIIKCFNSARFKSCLQQ